jgi:Snare region anchored in the vesicle membrane C-terminus
LTGTQTLSDGSRRIAESTGIALETESHGADILRTLVGQREQIENSRNTVEFNFLFFCRSFSLRMMVDTPFPFINQLQTADMSISKASSTIKVMIRQYVPFFELQGH